MGRPSDARWAGRHVSTALRQELQRQIENGRCAYCRAPALPDKPLTREHVIPRARGGRRKDVRIIVPACTRCNHRRGCTELVPFLLARPRRISSFLDYLGTLPPEIIREMDLRVFAEVYTAVALLSECSAYGPEWRDELQRLSSGRTLHRRRYAARRAVGSIAQRVESGRVERGAVEGPTCLVPPRRDDVLGLHLEEPLDQLASRVVSVFALLWHVSAEVVHREMKRALDRAVPDIGEAETDADEGQQEGAPAPALDGWKPARKRRRVRVDRRRGRAVRPAPAGRAA